MIEGDGKLETRIRYKFAFQYCEGQGTPWWLEKTSAHKDYLAASQAKPSSIETDPRSEQSLQFCPRNEGCLIGS